jgi:protein-S-isoprenylcysteine O-methyltransferase Ste14
VGSIVWKILYWAWLVSELLLIALTRTRRSTGNVRDRGSIFVLWIVIFAAISIGSWYAAVHPQTIFGGAHWVRTAAVYMLAAGLAIRWTAIYSLGRSFSVNVAIHADQKLYRKGLFALVRHPSYLGMMILFAALGVRTRNWIACGIILVPSLAALLYRMHVEEAALRQAFGQEYEEYRSRTKRLLPWIY